MCEGIENTSEGGGFKACGLLVPRNLPWCSDLLASPEMVCFRLLETRVQSSPRDAGGWHVTANDRVD